MVERTAIVRHRQCDVIVHYFYGTYVGNLGVTEVAGLVGRGSRVAAVEKRESGLVIG